MEYKIEIPDPLPRGEQVYDLNSCGRATWMRNDAIAELAKADAAKTVLSRIRQEIGQRINMLDRIIEAESKQQSSAAPGMAGGGV